MAFFKSKTKWEDSFFGGTLSILKNHPILSGWHITVKTIDFDKTSSLFYYEKEKLAKILIYKVYQKYKGSPGLLNKIFNLAEDNVDAYYLQPYAIRYVYSLYMNDTDDVAPLFETFQEDLFNLEVKIKKSKPGESSFEDFVELLSEIKEVERFRSLVGNRDFKVKFQNSPSFAKPISYEPDEILASNQLISSLDINFAVGTVRHDNLITGKLAEHKLAEGYSGNTQIYYRESEKINTKPFHVCILMDQSGSMKGSRYKKSYELLRVLYRTFSSVLPPEKLSIYGHSGKQDPEINIYQEYGINSFNETYYGFLSAELCENYDGPVTEQIHKRIRSKTKDAILMIVVSDGSPSGYEYGYCKDVEDFKKVIERAKRDDFIIAGVGIESAHVDHLYKYHTVVRDKSKIVSQVSRLVNFIVKTEFQS